MPTHEPASNRLGGTPEVPGPSDEAVVDAYAANLPEIEPQQMHRLVTRIDEPEEWADGDLVMLGCTREDAVNLAHEIRRGLGPAYRRVLASTHGSHLSAIPLAARRVGTRARGAGRPAARRSRTASSSSGSGDDGSGPADPEPSSRPARRWALYRQPQPTGGRQRAVIVRLDGASTWRAEP